MFNKLFRAVFTVIGMFFGYELFELTMYITMRNGIDFKERFNDIEEFAIAALFVIIFGLLFFRLTPVLKRQSGKVAESLEKEMQKWSLSDLITSTIGLIAGLVIAYLITKIYSGINIPALKVVLNIITYIIMGFIGITIATSKGKDFVADLVSMPKISAGKLTKHKQEISPKILDTSVIIDGRIAEIVRTGFLEGPVVIPEFVLVELRHIADSSDSLKRQRGRKGLDVLNKMHDEYGIDIYNTEEEEKALDEIPEVDVKLLKLAQIMEGKVVTNDFNLNKVAAIKGVPVLNINELANVMKPIVLPGEEMVVSLVKQGKEKDQAIAYLDDGTMIVIEDGSGLIGETINIVVTSILQTAAGRMIFGRCSQKPKEV